MNYDLKFVIIDLTSLSDNLHILPFFFLLPTKKMEEGKLEDSFTLTCVSQNSLGILEFSVEKIWTWPSTPPKKWYKHIAYLNENVCMEPFTVDTHQGKNKTSDMIPVQFYCDHVIVAFWKDHWLWITFLTVFSKIV